jgi:copper chaperone CopZ
MRTAVLDIKGMHCDSCVQNISRHLQALPGVRDVKVDLTAQSARVSHDESICGTGDLLNAVRKAGYQVEGFTTV